MHHTFSIGDWSGLQAGHASTRTLWLHSRSCNPGRILFGVILLENAGMSQEKKMSGRQHMLLQNVYITCCINGAFTYGHWHNPLPWQRLTFGSEEVVLLDRVDVWLLLCIAKPSVDPAVNGVHWQGFIKVFPSPRQDIETWWFLRQWRLRDFTEIPWTPYYIVHWINWNALIPTDLSLGNVVVRLLDYSIGRLASFEPSLLLMARRFYLTCFI